MTLSQEPLTICPAKPLISIALCAYNGSLYIEEQLDSLLAQTYKNLEIVIVDDSSTDQTVSILRAYQRRDSRIKIFINERNIGLNGNFDFALRQCTGVFIAPADQDDIWALDKVEKLQAAIGPNAMVYCDSELVDARGVDLGVRISDIWRTQDIRDVMALVLENCVSGHAVLFRSELLQLALPIPDGLFHDWWLAAVAAENGGVSYFPEILVKYRQHSANVTDLLRTRKDICDVRGAGATSVSMAGRRMALLACLAGQHQHLMRELSDLWVRREHQWFSISLARFMLRHRDRIFLLRHYSKSKAWFKAFKYVVGLRMKRTFNRRRYGFRVTTIA